MKIAHLTASTFFGGPERQMLGLATALAGKVQTAVLSFAERDRCHTFLQRAGTADFEAAKIKADTPNLRAAVAELSAELARLGSRLLFCHGYKANLLGRIAARRRGIPAVAVARGWTGESFKVRCYEALDRFHLRWMDHVVCVSEAQAVKVRLAGVPGKRISVIANAVDPTRFQDADPIYRNKLLRAFRQPVSAVVGAAGRLSPEKGFDVFVKAAGIVHQRHAQIGFALFGDGPCKDALGRQVKSLGLAGCFTLNGFRSDLDRFVPFFDLLVLPSHTEGLPNIVLEALGAGVPVVATAVGGTPELVTDGNNGYLVRPGNAEDLAAKIAQALDSPQRSKEMAANGRQTISERFTFEKQASQYLRLMEQLTGTTADAAADKPASNALVESGPTAPCTVPGSDMAEVRAALNAPGNG
jgi:glycosyltransferase involved in cell wall biosynthesis